MNTAHSLKRISVGAPLSGVVAATGLGLGAGVAQANNQGPFQWCPGQPMSYPGPGTEYVWDMGSCHTWYRVDYGLGDVGKNIPPPPESNVWDGDNPLPSDRCYPWCLR
jgi:hypothetical protein